MTDPTPEHLTPPDITHPPQAAAELMGQLLTGADEQRAAADHLAAAHRAARGAYDAAQERDRAIRTAYSAGIDVEALTDATGLSPVQIHRIILSD